MKNNKNGDISKELFDFKIFIVFGYFKVEKLELINFIVCVYE